MQHGGRALGLSLAGIDPQADYFWQDANNDQIVQLEELVSLKGVMDGKNVLRCLNKDLSVLLTGGKVLRPLRVTENGQPIYDIQKTETTPCVGKLSYGHLMPDPDGSVYYYDQDGNHGKGPALIKWSPKGEMLWNYPGIISWPHALDLPITKAGRLWGMTGPMGVAGNYLAYQTYFGVNHIFRRDGVYVGAVLRDGRLGGRGPDEGQPEGQIGQFVKLQTERDGPDRYFVIHGGQDSRVWEVLGLDTVKTLPGGVYHHTEEMVAKATVARTAYEAAVAGTKRLVLARTPALETVQSVGRTLEDNRGFEVRAACDADNLYLRYDVFSPNELVNTRATRSSCSRVGTFSIFNSPPIAARTPHARPRFRVTCVCW